MFLNRLNKTAYMHQENISKNISKDFSRSIKEYEFIEEEGSSCESCAISNVKSDESAQDNILLQIGERTSKTTNPLSISVPSVPLPTNPSREDLESEGYRLIGNHSLVKICDYTKKSLRGKDVCYKNTFYGIRSWRCIQMSPTHMCNHACTFCWRDTRYVYPQWQGPVDSPKSIVEGCINEQIKLLNGFGGSPSALRQRYLESKVPIHVAISLTGEPTMYPLIDELVGEFKRRGMSTFLVTNGTLPHQIKKLLDEPPTQLYVTLPAPDEETYLKIARPIPKNTWPFLMETLSLLKQFNRSVVRLTLVKNWNMHNPEGYAKIIEQTQSDFVELKGYVWMGHSRERLENRDMPFHEGITAFAKELLKYIPSYEFASEKKESSVILLARKGGKERAIKFESSV